MTDTPRFTANFSRKVMEKSFPFERTEKDWLISICNADANNVRHVPGFDRVEYFHFDDVIDDEDPWGPTEADIDRIVATINEARELNKNVWVNCHAGICRSGAVVVLLEMLGWTYVADYSIKPIPNMIVLEMLRKRFDELQHSWEVDPGSVDL